MKSPSFDPGFTQKYSAKLRRVIRKDGAFNVQRTGRTWRDVHPYLFFINKPWLGFFGLIFAVFIAVNVLFAITYYFLGIEHIQGADAPTELGRFWNAFFFSTQTLTTVGYGSLSPRGLATNLVASFEAMVGLMGFAVFTGFLVGRVTRPSARIGFSKSMIVAPYQDGSSLQFRIVNRSMSNLMEVEARVMLMTVEPGESGMARKFNLLKLERDSLLFLALTWTVVHAIDAESPLSGKTAADLEREQAEVLILVKGVDDTFSQTVHARYSYTHDEIVWGAQFAPAFEIDDQGNVQLEVKRVSDIIKAPRLNQ